MDDSFYAAVLQVAPVFLLIWFFDERLRARKSRSPSGAIAEFLFLAFGIFVPMCVAMLSIQPQGLAGSVVGSGLIILIVATVVWVGGDIWDRTFPPASTPRREGPRMSSRPSTRPRRRPRV